MAPKVVFITGCSSGGIGHGLAVECAMVGCLVYASARKIESMKGLDACGCRLLALDVTWPQDRIQQVVDQVLAEAGRIDVLINNAGLLCRGFTPDMPAEVSRRTFDVNYFGALAVTQAVAPSMMANLSGTIVNIGSIGSYINTPLMACYGASKAALMSWSDSLRFELAPFGVRVALVAPGFIGSHMTDGVNAQINPPPAGSLLSRVPSFVSCLPYDGKSGFAKDSTPYDVYVRDLAPKLLRPNPPFLLVGGHMAWPMTLLAWFAAYWVRDWFYRTFFFPGWSQIEAQAQAAAAAAAGAAPAAGAAKTA